MFGDVMCRTCVLWARCPTRADESPDSLVNRGDATMASNTRVTPGPHDSTPPDGVWPAGRPAQRAASSARADRIGVASDDRGAVVGGQDRPLHEDRVRGQQRQPAVPVLRVPRQVREPRSAATGSPVRVMCQGSRPSRSRTSVELGLGRRVVEVAADGVGDAGLVERRRRGRALRAGGVDPDLHGCPRYSTSSSVGAGQLDQLVVRRAEHRRGMAGRGPDLGVRRSHGSTWVGTGTGWAMGETPPITWPVCSRTNSGRRPAQPLHAELGGDLRGVDPVRPRGEDQHGRGRRRRRAGCWRSRRPRSRAPRPRARRCARCRGGPRPARCRRDGRAPRGTG